MRDRLLTAAKTQKTEPLVSEAQTAEDTENTKPRSKLPGILSAIALGTIALLGLNNYRLWRVTQTPDAVETSQRTYLLQGEDFPDRVQAQLTVDNKQLNATLNVSNLPPLPPEQAYALWTVVGKDVPYTTDGKGAILTAVFQVDAAGNFDARNCSTPTPSRTPNHPENGDYCRRCRRTPSAYWLDCYFKPMTRNFKDAKFRVSTTIDDKFIILVIAAYRLKLSSDVTNQTR